jgi:hypothetical protein
MDMKNEPQVTSDDYLWDGSGKPYPEIQKLDGLLGKFRYDSPAPVFPEIIPRRHRIRWIPIFAAATAAAVVVVTILTHERKSVPIVVAGWSVSGVTGTPRVGTRAIRVNEGAGRLGVGQVLETDQQSRARLQAEQIGQIEVEPGTRLRLLSMGTGLKRIALDRGTIDAFIWSPPGEFVVDTPSAVTVDLGCAYTLHVDDAGNGVVRTSLGWVGFKLNGHESFIPAGAACETRPKTGPGTPYFEDASLKFRTALSRFDFEDNTPQERVDDLAIVLAGARKRDALTLWHLLSRVEEGQRLIVYDRLVKLAPPSAGVTKEGILRLDRPMLDMWWNQLGFDDISIWRHWEHDWAGTSATARGK